MKRLCVPLAVVMILTLLGCNGSSSNDAAGTPVSSQKEITAYSIDGVAGRINETEKTITVVMPAKTNATALVATFTTTGKSVTVGGTQQTSGTTPNDFTNPVAYTVTAEDSSTAVYTVSVMVATVDLIETGQTTCYDSDGNLIDCAGTGQDGELRRGVAWPNPRFTDNGDQTVTDNLTGLIWTKDGNLMETRDPGFDTGGTVMGDTAGDGLVLWQRALDYVKKLNQENYLGHNDWRLPNIVELESLIHAGQVLTTAWLNTQGFSNVQDEFYWSSTTIISDGGNSQLALIAWPTGNIQGGVKGDHTRVVWPVRSGGTGVIELPKTGQTTCYDSDGNLIDCVGTGQDGELQKGAAWPNPRFADNGDGTVTDKLTGLMWTKDGNAPGPTACSPGVTKSWQEALDYVKCLNTNNYLGYNDWRLPNRKELYSLSHYGQVNDTADWLNSQGFSNVQRTFYVSSTTYPAQLDCIFLVNVFGEIGVDGKNRTDYSVWPVRGGQ